MRMSRSRKSPFNTSGFCRVCWSSRSAARRVTTYSRSTDLMRVPHTNASFGMGSQLLKNLAQTRFRQGFCLRFTNVGSGLLFWRCIMEVLLLAVVVKAGDVVVPWHEVQINYTLGPRSAPRNWLE